MEKKEELNYKILDEDPNIPDYACLTVDEEKSLATLTSEELTKVENTLNQLKKEEKIIFSKDLEFKVQSLPKTKPLVRTLKQDEDSNSFGFVGVGFLTVASIFILIGITLIVLGSIF